MRRFEVLILGNSSATPMYGRHPTSQVLNFNEQLFLIDCGEGTQMQLFRYGIRSTKINHIFISHLHGDHYLGLVGLLSSQHLVGRQADLHLYGPAALQQIINLQFKHSDTRLRYNLVFHPTNPHASEVILETATLKVSSFPLLHRIDCTGFRFDEGKMPASLQAEKVEALQVPVAFLKLLKKGIDCVDKDGTIYKASELTYPAAAARSYGYCSDTVMNSAYFDAIRGVDLLYHEATFLHDMVDRAKETFHTTCLEAGQVAKDVGAKKLLLGHYSARYKDLQPLLEESRSAFPQTELSEEGRWFVV
ncbi:ribonuclease Z [Sphingobacterium griseoflavum]|uniref:Ribonuclease Z n=1 Tax=Sphingobacterium griseoflavum TaxID=1474952 RepID=A0ABQ3HRE0_9SPHI|nr:ribonuclease Z [Sphingobacterium griseoflavum]GHE23808.1 ribonuclease Z [Sphingobacterium griseoflavum]